MSVCGAQRGAEVRPLILRNKKFHRKSKFDPWFCDYIISFWTKLANLNDSNDFLLNLVRSLLT